MSTILPPHSTKFGQAEPLCAECLADYHDRLNGHNFSSTPEKPTNKVETVVNEVLFKYATFLGSTPTVQITYSRELLPIISTAPSYFSFSSSEYYYLFIPKNPLTPEQEEGEIKKWKDQIKPDTEEENKKLGLFKYSGEDATLFLKNGAAFKTKDPVTSKELVIDKFSVCFLLIHHYNLQYRELDRIKNLLDKVIVRQDVQHIGDVFNQMFARIRTLSQKH